jgi:hypothetical protein
VTVYNIPNDLQLTLRGRHAKDDDEFINEQYLQLIDINDNRKLIVFFSIADLQSIIHLYEKDKRIEWFCDGNYKYSLIEFNNSGELYVINCSIDGDCQPIVFALTTKTDEIAYTKIFECLKSSFDVLSTVDFMGDQITGSIVMQNSIWHLDYERATLNAIQKVMPQSTIHGCSYYLAHAFK